MNLLPYAALALALLSLAVSILTFITVNRRRPAIRNAASPARGSYLVPQVELPEDWEPPSAAVTPQAGMRPMTPDGLPIIGRLGRLVNTYVSTGHGMLGVTLAPGTAAALTDLIVHDKAAPALERCSPGRVR